MTLLEWINTFSPEGKKDIAKQCDTTVGQFMHLAYGNRKPNIPTAVKINRLSKGAVKLELLRSDVDWNALQSGLAEALAA